VRRGTLGAWLVIGLLAAFAVAAYADRDPAVRSLLRLGDLGPGYVTDDDGGCGPPDSEGASRRFLRFNDEHRQYHICDAEFDELWRPPNAGPRPRMVSTMAIRFASSADARDASRIVSEFADYGLAVPSRSMRRIGTRRAAGAEFRVYRTNDALVDDVPRRPAIIVAWRTARILSLVLRSGGAAAAQADAVRLAEIQQQRVLHPTPLPAHANDDRFVSLNNPTVGFPVHWLGLRFRAPGLPPLSFREGRVSGSEDLGPGSSAEIGYKGGVDLAVWRPAAWARFTRSRVGRLVWSAGCTRATRVALPTGYAMVYAGHVKHQTHCGRRPDRFLAHVYLPSTVVTVNQPICLLCIDRGHGPDPWNTERGMEAIVRGLTIRPPG
jgi:hypothetical protein